MLVGVEGVPVPPVRVPGLPREGVRSGPFQVDERLDLVADRWDFRGDPHPLHPHHPKGEAEEGGGVPAERGNPGEPVRRLLEAAVDVVEELPLKRVRLADVLLALQ